MAIEIRPDEMLSASQHGRARCVQNCKMCLSIPISQLFKNVPFKRVQHFSFQQEVKGGRHGDRPSITIPWKWASQRRALSEGHLITSLRITAHIKSSIQTRGCKKRDASGNKQQTGRSEEDGESDYFHADIRQFFLQLKTRHCVLDSFVKGCTVDRISFGLRVLSESSQD